MSVAKLHNEMRRQALMAMKSIGRDRLGLVSSYDPTAYAVKVEIQPEGIETGWIPLKSPWVGNGWGFFGGPVQGAQVKISFQEGHIEAALCDGGFFSDEDRPLPVPSGELWIVHQSGASFKLTNDGALTLVDGHGAQIRLSGGQITSSGPWVHTGTITATGDIVAGSISLEHHVHGGVMTGGSTTSAPQG